MLEKYSRMVQDYKTWFPSLYEKTVECKPCSKYSILVELDDGSRMEYDGIHNTVRDVTKHYVSDQQVNEEDWRKEFGHRLRQAMAARGINQEALSDISGISRQMLTRYVRGHSTPSGYNLTRLSEILKCDIRDLTRFNYIDEE